MLALQSGPVTIVNYVEMGHWRKEGPYKYGDGSPVEAVVVQVPGEERTREIQLSRDLNGDRPAVGATVSLLLEEELKAKGRMGRDGRPYVAYVEHRLLVGSAKA